MNNILLIQSVRNRKPLWDKAEWDKMDYDPREVMWDEVAELIKRPKEIVKARWKNLRDNYRKMLMGTLSGTRSRAIKWRYYKHMDFMRDTILKIRPKVVDIAAEYSDGITPDYTITLKADGNGESLNPNTLTCSQDSQPSVKFEAVTTGREERDEIPTENTDVGNNEERSIASQPTYLQQVPMKKKLPLRIKIEKLLYETIYGDNDPLSFAHQI